MSSDKNKDLTGAGGGGKGGGRAPTEVQDNQFSSVVARALTAYSSGTTGGLIDGDKSVYLNETRLQSLGGSYNFQGVSTAQSDGTGFAPTIPPTNPAKGSSKSLRSNFTQVSSVVNVNTVLEFGTPVVRTVSDVDVDAVRIIITVPALQEVLSNGDIKGTAISLKYEVRDPASGIWEDRGTRSITGKSSGAFQRAVRIAAPDTVTAAWDWRVTRLTADSVSARLSNDTTVQAATELFYGREEYLGTACIGVEIATEDFGNSLPGVAFEVSGVKVQVPSNYTVTNGIPNYAGIWDGTFIYESTSNPVWHLYNLIVDTDIGLGLAESFVDRYNFYEAARYCDAVDETGTYVGVDDGEGGVRRRFTFNTQINGQQDGIEMLQQIASSMRGILYFGAGAVVLKQDAPRATARIVTNDNVKDGLFAYSSTAAKDRITVAKVAFNDPDDFFRLRYSIYPKESDWAADANIARFGRNELEVTKMGCANEAEAHAFAQWMVYTSCNEDRTVTFLGGPEFLLTRPGDVLEIADRRIAGAASFDQRYGGRIAGGDLDALELDYPIELAVGETYSVTIVGADGTTLETRNVTNLAGTVDTLSLDVALPANPTIGYTWLVTGTDIAPQKFSVINIERKDGLEVEIFAVKYDENKFAAVESGIEIIPKPYTKIDVTDLPPPTNMTFQQVPFNDPIRGILNNLIIRWDASTSDLVSRYNVRWRRDNDAYVMLPPTAFNEITLPDVVEATYDFIVTAVNPLGYESTPLNGTYDVVYGATFEWEGAPIFIQQPVMSNTSFNTKDMLVTWTRAAGNDVPGIVFRRYKIDIFVGNDIVKTDYTTNTEYTYFFDELVTYPGFLFTPRSLGVEVYEEDVYGNQSIPGSVTYSNPLPTVPLLPQAAAGAESMVISWTPPANETDIAGYKVYLDTTPSFAVNDLTNLVYNGPNTETTLDGLVQNTTYYYKLGAYDVFDETIGPLTAEGTILTKLISVDDAVTEYNFNGITFSVSGTVASWTAGSVISVTGPTVTTTATTAGNANFIGTTIYIYYDPLLGDLTTGTNLTTVLAGGERRRIVATWDGSTLKDGTADPIIDGANILAETIGATQVVTSGLITNTAQINDAIITGAKIGNLEVETANINDLSVNYFKIGNNAVTDGGFAQFPLQVPTVVNSLQQVVFSDTFSYAHPCLIVFTFQAGPGTATILGSDTMFLDISVAGTTRLQKNFTGSDMDDFQGYQVAFNGLIDFNVNQTASVTLRFNLGMAITNAECLYTYQVFYR